MSVSANPRPLLLGIGNPLRGDDSLGRIVAGQLAQAGDLECEVQVVYQLTPELAESMAAASLVVMIDASREGDPGDIRVRQISPTFPAPGAIGVHHVTPDELAALTVVIYGHCPPVMVISITGADFNLGEQLSPSVTRAIFLVGARIRQILRSGKGE
ncbi:MAG TPA: hydrogenase maturation protease [Ktedonobacteraceae bacterium]